MATHIGDIPIIFGDSRQPKALPLSHPKARWPGFKQETIVLKKGYRRRRGCLALTCDIVYERDTPVLLRDGTRVYVDIYRPVGGVVPAIVAWSPYGKYGGKGNQVLDDFPFRMGVPLWKLSELQKWEAPDPAYWVQRGYAVVNPDPRGVGKSEGNIYQFGSQEGRDGADVIDWAGEQTWCNGKVATAGNSWLSISSWFIAAERPKHLAAIAPWEGLTDIAGEGARGGVQSKPAMDFNLQLLQVNAGEGSWENPIAMLKKYKTANAYSVDKAARIEDIEVPAYVVASWTNPIHTYGTFRGYCRLKSDKWLRVHDSWEWPDFYADAHQADLLRFFDHFLKDVDNGWETTPRVRMKILDTANPLPLTGSDLVVAAFPPPETTTKRLYLDGRRLAETAGTTALHYKASSVGVKLDYTFAHDTMLCGPLVVHLKLSLTEADSDVFVVVQKILKTGEPGAQLKIPYEKSWQSFAIRTAYRLGVVPEVGFLFYQGPTGQVRVSRRAMVDIVPGLPIPDYSKNQPVEKGEKVDVPVPMTPIGMKFAAGETFRIAIQGKDPAIFPPVDQGTLTVDGVEDLNKDVSVTIYSEGSYIDLPIVQSR